MSRTIKGSEIVADLRAGMHGSEIMEKYSLSQRELRSVIRQVKLERDARIQRISADFLKGMPVTALMKKYGISASALRTVLAPFSVELTLEVPDLDRHHSDACDQVIINYRREPRHQPVGEISARIHTGEIREGFLRDISEHGLALVGVRTRVSEVGGISVLGDDSGLIEPFELTAECRWTGTESNLGRPMAGFLIAEISPSNSLRLRDLIENYTNLHA